MKPTPFLCAVCLWLAGCASPDARRQSPDAAILDALTFYASFDKTPAADFSLGDPHLYWATNMARPRVGQPGLPPNWAVIHNLEGRAGRSLRFIRKDPGMVFYQAAGNVPYQAENWSGTVSFWLRVDPAAELAEGFCDPVQITSKEWNDAAFFVEFEKRATGIPFRLGVYADKNVWNPEGREWSKIPPAEKPLITVVNPPFAGHKWTHVVFTFANFNTGQSNGVARLYLDGRFISEIAGRQQTFHWEPAEARLMIGLNYLGGFDDLAVFNRALEDAEVQRLKLIDLKKK